MRWRRAAAVGLALPWLCLATAPASSQPLVEPTQPGAGKPAKPRLDFAVTVLHA